MKIKETYSDNGGDVANDHVNVFRRGVSSQERVDAQEKAKIVISADTEHVNCPP